MQPKHALRIVLSSPSDVDDECRVMDGVIAELNRGVAHERHAVLELTHWKTDAYPGFHPDGAASEAVPPFRSDEQLTRLGTVSDLSNIAFKDSCLGGEKEPVAPGSRRKLIFGGTTSECQ